MPGIRIFSHPEVLEEMLELRRQGHTFSDIARKYGADHTTVMFHCQAAGLALTAAQKLEMYKLIREGLSVDDVGGELGVSGWLVEFYCNQNGVPGSDKYPTKAYYKKMQLDENQLNAMEKRDAARKRKRAAKLMFKTDERGVMWRTDEFGEWICLGKESYKRGAISSKDKKEILNKKRREMLEY